LSGLGASPEDYSSTEARQLNEQSALFVETMPSTADPGMRPYLDRWAGQHRDALTVRLAARRAKG